MNFRALNKNDMALILKWRSKCPESLRTNKELTIENQLDFYDNVISNKNSNARWWGIEVNYVLVGYCAIENTSWENRNGEISLLIDPEYHDKGYGKEAIKILLDKGFNQLNLNNIYGEVYLCNSAVSFWEKIIKQYNGTKSIMPNRKYWNGQYYDAIYFNFEKGDYLRCLKLS
jgi:RimJ/RimL family protein N-acetyltransferase